MIRIENVETYGWEAAIRGMRNPLNSWDKIDTKVCDTYSYEEWCTDKNCKYKSDEEYVDHNCCLRDESDWYINHAQIMRLGDNDKDLMKRLRNAGTDHRKFMRMITVYLDITAPLYWWKEFDTYKVGTVANSCSTMHKIHTKEFTLDDFSYDRLKNDDYDGNNDRRFFHILEYVIDGLNQARISYLETKDKHYWWQIIQLLPSSYNQKRTVMLNYEVLANMYASRKNHKLDEWLEFCAWMETLPYFELITGKFK